jgi:hypothetical protein
MNAISAAYSGDSHYAPSSSTAITVMVLGPDFTFEATPSTISATPGQSVSASLLVTPKNGFNQTPMFRCVGLPAGSTCSFAAPVKQSDGTSRVGLTIHTAAQTARNDSRSSEAPLALALLPCLLWWSRKEAKKLRRLMSLCAIFAALLLLGAGASGCGGHSSLATPGTSTSTQVTVTAQTTSGLSHTATIELLLK